MLFGVLGERWRGRRKWARNYFNDAWIELPERYRLRPGRVPKTTGSAERVSVVIPVRDGERYLGAAIESVLAQGHDPHEIIVVDDGSTDGSAAVGRAFGAPVIVVSQPAEGVSAAVNRGRRRRQGSCSRSSTPTTSGRPASSNARSRSWESGRISAPSSDMRSTSPTTARQCADRISARLHAGHDADPPRRVRGRGTRSRSNGGSGSSSSGTRARWIGACVADAPGGRAAAARPRLEHRRQASRRSRRVHADAQVGSRPSPRRTGPRLDFGA